ncbi:hypothetical protein Pelo_15212 [Pelomyxa schiedti]|nr:hypothetical protein Pelo_15212 [Pelomyxa schiedti]
MAVHSAGSPLGSSQPLLMSCARSAAAAWMCWALPFSPAGCTHPSDTPSARTQRGPLGFLSHSHCGVDCASAVYPIPSCSFTNCSVRYERSEGICF